MSRRFIAAALLAVLTILGGMDLLEDTGLIHYSTTEMDRRVEDVLDNYGEAIRSTEDIPNRSLNLTLLAFCACGPDAPDLASRNPGSSLRRKQSIDFAKSAFNPFTYSQILLV